MAESVSNTEPDFPSLCKLEICGAVYGKCDVTEVVKKLIQDESLTVKASNDVFGDTWKRHNKTLVIVYKYDGGPNSDHVKQAILKEGDTLRLTPPRSQAVASLGLRGKENSQLKILGATYGLADVTNLAQSLVTDGGEFNQMASNEVWGNSWPGVKKTLVVVYTYSNTYMVDIAIKGQRMHFIASPPLCILGAVYGLEDVTTDVQHLVKNRSFSATANNSTFGNGSWRWRKKSLVIVYQYGDETPTVATAKQGKPLEFRYAKSPEFSGCRDPSTLTILGAAYGPRDVTQVVQSRANNNVGATFHITANNDTFSDTLRGHKKSFVVVYRYGYDAPQVQAIQEGQSIQWGQ